MAQRSVFSLLTAGREGILVAFIRNCVLLMNAICEEIIALSVFFSLLQVDFLSWEGKQWTLPVIVVLTGGLDHSPSTLPLWSAQ